MFMSSRRGQKDARRSERMRGAEGQIRKTTQTLVAAARRAGHNARRIREDILCALKDALGVGLLESRSVVIDSRTEALIDHSGVFQRVIDQQKIELLDPAVRQWCLSVVEDELDEAL
jgi:hypothetical protein